MSVLEAVQPVHRHGNVVPVQPRHTPRDLIARVESMQLMIDLGREDSEITQPFVTAQVVNYSFVEIAHRDLGVSR